MGGRRKVSGFDYISRALGQSELENIFKFPYVSGPGVSFQNGEGLGREGDFSTKKFLGVEGQKMLGQKGNVP